MAEALAYRGYAKQQIKSIIALLSKPTSGGKAIPRKRPKVASP